MTLRFGVLGFAFLLMMIWAKGGSFWEHSPYDQQTLAAEAWLNGRTDLAEKPPYLEIAEYKGKFYSSFPPTAALFEVPFVLARSPEHRRETPNTAVQVLLVLLAAVTVFAALSKTLQSTKLAAFYAGAFFFGTQMLYLSVEARIWHQGHCFAVAFGAFAAALIYFAQKWSWALGSGVCLGLATGSRPDVLFSAPYFAYTAFRRKKLLPFVAGLALPLLALFIYNAVRFDSPFEFGHKYLSWSQQLPFGIFSTAYLSRNLYHALLNPTLHGRGTSLILVEPVLVIAAIQFFRSKLSIEDKTVAALSVLACWVPLLLHESNGWYQFGYRFGVDLIPVLFLMLLTSGPKSYPKWTERLLAGVFIYSILFNIYGMMWFYRWNKP